MEPFDFLPDDLLLHCFLRTTYKTHPTLKSVCRQWRAVVRSPQFYADRRNNGTSEHLICLLHHITNNEVDGDVYGISVYDPAKGTWERLPPIPPIPGLPLDSKCVSVNRKLVVLGGWNRSYSSATRSVYIFNFETANWRRGADMPTLRSFFCCSVSPSTGLIYVAGGNDGTTLDILASAEVYDVETDTWVILPDMTQKREASVGVFIQGKFMVISGLIRERLDQFHTSADVFDPNTGAWSRLEGMWTSTERLSHCAFAASSGHLYVFNKRLGVMKYDAQNNVWTDVATLPQCFLYFFCAAEWRDRIFVTGVDSRRRKISYMFQPSTAQWTALEWQEDFATDVAVSLEI